MVDIFAPENDKKRLVVLLVILAIVMIASLVYKTTVLSPVEVPVVEDASMDTAQKTDGPTVGTLDSAQTSTDEQMNFKLPVPPTQPNAEDLKKISEEVAKRTQQALPETVKESTH